MHNNLILENFDESFLSLPSLIDERKKAFSELKKIGIPNKKVENWKYTDLNNLTKAIEFKPGTININSLLGANITSSSPLQGKVKIDTGTTEIKSSANVDVSAETGIDLTTNTRDVTIKATAGNVSVEGLLIYLN